MIITPAQRVSSAPSGTRWASLARRGMLWSEVQVMDVTAVEAGGTGPFLDPDCLELVLCSRGTMSFRVDETCEVVLLAGQLMLVAPASAAVATAGGHGAELIRIRILPDAVRRRVPARRPGLTRPATNPALGAPDVAS